MTKQEVMPLLHACNQVFADAPMGFDRLYYSRASEAARRYGKTIERHKANCEAYLAELIEAGDNAKEIERMRRVVQKLDDGRIEGMLALLMELRGCIKPERTERLEHYVTVEEVARWANHERFSVNESHLLKDEVAEWLYRPASQSPMWKLPDALKYIFGNILPYWRHGTCSMSIADIRHGWSKEDDTFDGHIRKCEAAGIKPLSFDEFGLTRTHEYEIVRRAIQAEDIKAIQGATPAETLVRSRSIVQWAHGIGFNIRPEFRELLAKNAQETQAALAACCEATVPETAPPVARDTLAKRLQKEIDGLSNSNALNRISRAQNLVEITPGVYTAESVETFLTIQKPVRKRRASDPEDEENPLYL